MRSSPWRGAVLLGVLLPLTYLAGCIFPDKGEESETVIDIVEPEPIPDPSTYVCDGDEQNLPREQGLKAQLRYLLPEQPRYTSVVDYYNYGQLVEGVDLFFNQLHIPTRPFDRGFTTMSGHTITTINGDTLYEYFSLRFSGRLQLGESPPGLYQLGLLSDDGAVLDMNFGNGFERVVDNDGTHPTRFGCASTPVEFQPGDKIPMRIDYYQGPRYHIALILMWRPWPEDNKWKDPLCGKEGNDLYFDSTKNPPQPQQGYYDLLARGWEPMPTINYLLPEVNQANPCNAPAPVISNFRVASISNTTVTIAWTTDIPARSLAYYRLSSDPVYTPTAETTVYDTVHFITISGLTPNTDYGVKAVSRSTSGLGTESVEIIVRTRR